jgi:hypothetical protein
LVVQTELESYTLPQNDLVIVHDRIQCFWPNDRAPEQDPTMRMIHPQHRPELPVVRLNSCDSNVPIQHRGVVRYVQMGHWLPVAYIRLPDAYRKNTPIRRFNLTRKHWWIIDSDL